MQRFASTLAVVGVLAALEPRDLRGVLASAAGLLLEALPFVVAAGALEQTVGRFVGRRFARWLCGAASCGCGGPASALSLPAAGLVWYAFGPAAGLVRLALAAGFVHGRPANHDGEEHDPLAVLAGLAPWALAGSAAASLLAAHAADSVPAPFAFAAGLAAGALFPCSLGGAAAGAALAHAAPALGLGFALAAGVAARPGARRFPGPSTPAAAGYAAFLVGALAAARPGAGLVHPHLAWAAAAAALWGFLRRPGSPRGGSPLAPALVGAALIAGAPPPLYYFDQTSAAGAFVGERVHFTGAVERHGGACLLVRFAITCCRADATPIALRLDRDPGYAAGSWAVVDGAFTRRGGGSLIVAVARVRQTPKPGEPFLYR